MQGLARDWAVTCSVGSVGRHSALHWRPDFAFRLCRPLLHASLRLNASLAVLPLILRLSGRDFFVLVAFAVRPSVAFDSIAFGIVRSSSL